MDDVEFMAKKADGDLVRQLVALCFVFWVVEMSTLNSISDVDCRVDCLKTMSK